MSGDLPLSVHLKVITPRKLLVDSEAKAVSLPSLEGYIGILPGHRPLVTALGKGEISYQVNQKQEKFSVEGGFAEILPQKIIVFTQLSRDES
ncbi:MAG: FoF1 ATP synthase subunit delta/epsilon [Candidatus Aminicenantes bacterium]